MEYAFPRTYHWNPTPFLHMYYPPKSLIIGLMPRRKHFLFCRPPVLREPLCSLGRLQALHVLCRLCCHAATHASLKVKGGIS